MVADAFRIAFEQQLRKRNENFLLLTEANILKSHQEKAEGKSAPKPVYDVWSKSGVSCQLPINADIKIIYVLFF